MNSPHTNNKREDESLKFKKLLAKATAASKSAQMCLDAIIKGASINIHPGLADFSHIQHIYKLRLAATQTKASAIIGFEETFRNFSTFKAPRIKMIAVTGAKCDFVIFADPDLTEIIGCLADPNPSAQSEQLQPVKVPVP